MVKLLIFICILISANNCFAATYYIDYFNGNDNSNGLSKLTAWKRAPGMIGYNGAYKHSEGDRFIFRGGVTWPSTVMPWSIAYSGATNNFDYYGIDQD
jgi:hypothetical protein